jgi:pyruvate dehydrogenase E1 component
MRSAIRDRLTRLIECRSDDELARLMGNLGGHDLPAIIDAFDRIDHDRPVCFIVLHDQGLWAAIRRPQG